MCDWLSAKQKKRMRKERKSDKKTEKTPQKTLFHNSSYF
jgi:hypothetical protein